MTWNDGDPVEVTTTVRDLIAAIDGLAEGQSTNKVALQTRLIYLALERQGQEVPPYDEWLDLLDEYEEIKAVNNGTGPTKPARSATGRSSSRASREPTGVRGSKRTTAPSKPPSSS